MPMTWNRSSLRSCPLSAPQLDCRRRFGLSPSDQPGIEVIVSGRTISPFWRNA